MVSLVWLNAMSMQERGTELKLKKQKLVQKHFGVFFCPFLVQFQVEMMMMKLQVGHSLIDRSQPLNQNASMTVELWTK